MGLTAGPAQHSTAQPDRGSTTERARQSTGGTPGHERSPGPHGDHLGIRRDEGIVHVAIALRAGRSDGRKRALYARIAALAHAYAGAEPRNVFVTLTENGPADWSPGHGEAQYLDS
ncbi:tautomerase family protein [Streptomyces sp. PsTaAH-124]|uniref:tautomerase family protein n=1 Tax=Streptomyces sp. PsTaAH-124 TaxID=1157638 RepID=UPI000997B335